MRAAPRHHIAISQGQPPVERTLTPAARYQPVLPSPVLTDEPTPATLTQINSPNNAGGHITNIAPWGGNVVSDQPPRDGTYFVPNLDSTSQTAPSQVLDDARADQRYHTQVMEQSMASASGMTAQHPSPPVGENVTFPPGEGTSSTAVPVPGFASGPAPTSVTGSYPHSTHLPQQQHPRGEQYRRLEAVHARLEKCRAEANLNDSDFGRYKVLRDACQNNDTYYIALHQILCQWSLDKSATYASLGRYLQPPDVDRGFVIVEKFLKQNGTLSFAHIQWFANFPSPQLEVCRIPNQLGHWVAGFLRSLCVSWGTMSEAVCSRQCPLLVSEMFQTLCCYSPTLQPVLFTMSYRMLNVTDSTWGMVLNDYFAEEQRCEAHMSASNPPLSVEEVVRNRAQFVTGYAKIIARARQQRPPNPGSSSPLTQQYMAAARRNPQRSNIQQPEVALDPQVDYSTPAVVAPLQDAQHRIRDAGHTVSNPSNHGRVGMSITNLDQRNQPNFTSHATGSQGRRMQPQASQPNFQVPVLASNASVRLHPVQSGRHQQPNAPLDQRHQGLQFGPYMSDAQVTAQMPGPGMSASFQTQQQQAQGQDRIPHGMAAQEIPLQRMPLSQPNLPQQGPYPPSSHTQRRPPSDVREPSLLHRYRTHPGLHAAVTEIHPHGYPISASGQHSLQVGLHLVGVRSPKRVPTQPVFSQPVPTRFYQYVRDLPVGPCALSPQGSVRSLKFNVPAANMARLTTKYSDMGLPAYRYEENSYRYRLRICMQSEREAGLPISGWAVSTCLWPKHIFITFNGKHLTLSRKQHFNKDLPLELTDAVVEGTNTISIAFPDVEANQHPSQLFIAVELVQTNSHNQLKKYITGANGTGTSADEMKEKIKRRLTPLDSDELVITDEMLRISLTDPFSARMLETPVRGVNCQHLECFDLENWLLTRPRKQTGKGRRLKEDGCELSSVDDWKCPICGGDARPVCLGIDHYLAQVCNDLLEEGRKNVNAIKVTANGQWEAIEEPDETDEDTPPPPMRTTSPSGNDGDLITRPSVVIEID
ncbi:hypothetical protein BGZ63DRAFT_423921 [Mariannaea sp. PMI_226]|nr:hypothetical protein BGZ63DRAFT_423921 [Mariannaea sp. PMI_226]